MVDPVTIAFGFTFERSAIAQWLAASATNPTTGEPLPDTVMADNAALRVAIAAWQKTHKQQLQQMDLQLQQEQPVGHNAESLTAAA
jgi:hypothetical protein